MPKKKNFNTSAILKEIYPMVETAMKTNFTKWKMCMSSFIQVRSKLLFDIAPCDRILYRDDDREAFFHAVGISSNQVLEKLKDAYFFDIPKYNPKYAKDPATVLMICIIRYFLLKNDQKNMELACIYLCFSGNYYPSIHYTFFKVFTPSKYRYVMEYVINHKLNDRFIIKITVSVIGSIREMSKIWVNTYQKEFKTVFDDEDVSYLMEQLHHRIKSFMKNIASIYYEAYKNKEYILYEKDSLPEEGDTSSVYHLSNNDSFRLQKYVENTMQKINTTQVDYKTCKMSSNNLVSTEEIKGIIEKILNDRENISKVKELVTCMIAGFFYTDESKDITSPAFLAFCIKSKPNVVNPILVRFKELDDEILNDTSLDYRKRKSRLATKMAYYKALNMYLAITIVNSNNR